jgi:uncharacterized protein YgiM (DUF1202 family)
MRSLIVVLLLIQGVFATAASGAEEPVEVEIADPYIELHTGPGRGYPIFYVIDRGETIQILRRRTDWFQVISSDGIEGWVHREQLDRTLTPEGEDVRVAVPGVEEFFNRRWEFGVTGGDFDGAEIVSVYGAFMFTRNFSTELTFSNVLGDFSNSYLANIGVVTEPFSIWRLSPFFTLGTGVVYTDPKGTLVEENDRWDQNGYVGGGIKMYLTRSLMLRLQYKEHVIFLDQDENQELNEWSGGLAFFF